MQAVLGIGGVIFAGAQDLRGLRRGNDMGAAFPPDQRVPAGVVEMFVAVQQAGDLVGTEAELADIQMEIDDIAFDLYGFTDADRAAAMGPEGEEEDDAEDEEAEAAVGIVAGAGLATTPSGAAGVAGLLGGAEAGLSLTTSSRVLCIISETTAF